ncbi:fatty acyl-AMP ligase [Parasphingorhabdus pacifica]
MRIAGGLVPEVRPGDAVAVLAADPGLIAPAVQGVWLAGGSVTMLHQPTPRTELAQWAQDVVRVLKMIGIRVVLLGPPFERFSGFLANTSLTCHDLRELVEGSTEPLPEPIEVSEDATALLQLTSGSTAEPKAVRISHGNLIANTRAMITATGLDPAEDVVVSWLPLFHDMGMVGCLTVPMTIGMETVKVTPAEFMARPLLWPELIGRYRGTVTAAPNFAYSITARRLGSAEDGAFDLSSLRFALNGAEPIDPEAVRSFTAEGGRFGLAPDAVVCAFGMAESTLAVSIGKSDRPAEFDAVDADALEQRGRAEPVDADSARSRRFALLGSPLPGVEVGVVDDSGRELGPRQIGQLRIRGESVTSDYLTVDGPVAAKDADGWLLTGDDGYLVDGQVVICGRRKDLIIVGGRNLYPVDIERAACQVEGVRPGGAAAVRQAAGGRRERFAVVVESRSAGDADAEHDLRNEVAARVVDAVGTRPSAVVVLAPGKLPKTPSGKLKRAATAELIER